MTNFLANTYKRLPITITHGKGAWLWDKEGNKYLDGFGGIAVCGLGHCHPRITHVIQQQAAKLVHVANYFHLEEQEELAALLHQISGLSRVFFCNSGAEANEAAIKLCRLYGHQKGIDDPQIIVTEKAFHGRTLSMISASGNRKIQAGYEPLVHGYLRAPYNNVAALKHLSNNPNIVALFLEPIQGEGGVIVPDANYLREVHQLCQKNNWLLVLDEVQTGVGRTGRFYAYQHNSGLLPDIVTTAKALGNGFPIAACLMGKKTADLFTPGSHGSTFGGNPLASKVGSTVIHTLQDTHLIERIEVIGKYLLQTFQEHLSHHPIVEDIRGKGLMIGIELTIPCPDILQLGLKHKVLFTLTSEKVIRLLPPYILQDSEVENLANRIISCINEFGQKR